MRLFSKKTIELSVDEERFIHIMQLLGDKTRFKLFKLLMGRNEMCVSDIAAELDISVSAVSQHFRNFEMVGLVDRKRMGQKICYLLKTNDPFVKEITSVISKK